MGIWSEFFFDSLGNFEVPLSDNVDSIPVFSGIVTTVKRNNRYYGPTESKKMYSFLSEVSTDLNTIFYQIDYLNDTMNTLASGYFGSDGYSNSIESIKKDIYFLEDKLNARIDGESVSSTLA